MPAGPRVLVVEDDPAIRRLIRAALDRSGYRVSEAADARTALSIAGGEKPDAMLLDLGLPDRDGLELIQLVKARPGAVVLVVSARTDTAEKVTALDLGADDYLTKPFDTDELLARLRTALRHGRVGGDLERPIVIGDIVVDIARHQVTRAGREVHLTPKEFGLLAELARRVGRVVLHGDLLRAIWGPAHEHQLEYLRIAVRSLRRKLEEVPATPRLILNEPGVGYRLTAPAA